ncbi:GMC oxidoreductase [Mycena floridula]|nr:GMC oxidoreductase [Mycena floridula]
MTSLRFLLHGLTALILTTAASSTQETFDFIIVGGGLAGLTLAARLSEDPRQRILVLEAGDSHLGDPLIDIPGFQGSTVGNASYDWNFLTLPQERANNRSFSWNRGKAIGGSTAINFMAWGRPAAREIDAIASLGNPGWTSESLFRYMKKAETFFPPFPLFAEQNHLTFIPEAHGEKGPVHASFSKFISSGQKPWLAALNSAGVPTIEDALAGNDVGAWMAPSTIDASTQTRSYAGSIYRAIMGRPNFVLLTDATVVSLGSINSTKGLTITHVTYLLNGTETNTTLSHGAEVILSAGTIKSPQILELSGIGNPEILQPLGIEVKLDLSEVGEGVIDQIFFGMSYEFKNDSIDTLDDLRDPIAAARAMEEYQVNKTGILTTGVTAFSLLPLDTVVGKKQAKTLLDQQYTRALNPHISARQSLIWKTQVAELRGSKNDLKVGNVELVAFPGFFSSKSTPLVGKKYLTFTVNNHLPFSTGRIHVASSSYTANPNIDPNYFEQEIDLTVLLNAAKFVRNMVQNSDFKDLFTGEIDPGPEVQSDADLLDYIKNFVGAEYHTVGSAAMLPRDKGGVVSPELKVYGTTNLRVVDMSILPLQITAHPMSFLYGVAEKAADIIQGKHD